MSYSTGLNKNLIILDISISIQTCLKSLLHWFQTCLDSSDTKCLKGNRRTHSQAERSISRLFLAWLTVSNLKRCCSKNLAIIFHSVATWVTLSQLLPEIKFKIWWKTEIPSSRCWPKGSANLSKMVVYLFRSASDVIFDARFGRSIISIMTTLSGSVLGGVILRHTKAGVGNFETHSRIVRARETAPEWKSSWLSCRSSVTSKFCDVCKKLWTASLLSSEETMHKSLTMVPRVSQISVMWPTSILALNRIMLKASVVQESKIWCCFTNPAAFMTPDPSFKQSSIAPISTCDALTWLGPETRMAMASRQSARSEVNFLAGLWPGLCPVPMFR